MNIRQDKMTASRRDYRAFTLIELLVVVFIIAVLISILLPTMSVIINKAQASKTSAWISSLAAGCETYKSQYQFYPGQDPFWSAVLAKTPAGANAYRSAQITGTQVLFRTLLAPNNEAVASNVMPYKFYEPCSNSGNLKIKDQYGNDRSGQYWDLGFQGPTSASRLPGKNNASDPGAICQTIADKFSNPMPILYYPARLSATGLTQFKITDNSPYWPFGVPQTTDANTTFSTQTANNFNMYITDPSMPNPLNAALASPYREGGFILISAGIDRKYGNTTAWTADPTARFTCDDIRNYSDNRN